MPRRPSLHRESVGAGRVALTLLALGAAFATGAGCAGNPRPERLTVAIAASLEPAFGAIGREFERTHPGVAVDLEPGSSTALAARVADGAPYAVLAGADAVRIGAIGTSLAGPVTVFADNRLAIVVPPGNPAGVRTLSDLAGLRFIALCDEAAPCGRYAAEVLAAAGVALDESHVTRAPDASATLRAVTRGDADAAIVYVTDARAAGRAVTTVAIPAAVNRTVPYGIAVLDRAEDPDLAREFVAAVTGPTGRAVLGAAGFGLP